MKIIETKRLILRTWKKEDAKRYFEINQNPQVIEFLRGPLTIKEVDDFIIEANKRQEKFGYTLFALESKENQDLMGFIGLNYTDFQADFTPAVEVGWRLDSRYWNQGYATEGALACLDFGFNKINLEEIISFTYINNHRSIKVMEKIGMKRDFNGDFFHPKLDKNHPLSPHVLYRKHKMI